MDNIAAYQDPVSCRAAADVCGTTHKTVKRVMDKFDAEQAGGPPAVGVEREQNYDAVADLVAERVATGIVSVLRGAGVLTLAVRGLRDGSASINDAGADR